MFLSDTELADLTGRRQKSHQIRWLQQNGIPFVVNACGRARVSRSCVEKKLGGIVQKTPRLPDLVPRAA